MPSSPSAPVATMKSTSPSKRLRSTLTTRRGTGNLAGLAFLHRFGLLSGFVDRAHHVEGLLGQTVVLALEDFFEAAHRLGDRHEAALAAGKTLSHAERLGQESLHLARSRNSLLVVFGQLLHAEDCDDVLQVLVALHDLLHPLRRVV